MPAALIKRYNNSVTIPGGGKILVTFKDADGKKTEAKAMDFRLKAAPAAGHSGEVHYDYISSHDDTFTKASAVNTQFFLYNGSSFRTESGEVIAKMAFYNTDGADIDLFMFARSDVDISGSTMA